MGAHRLAALRHRHEQFDRQISAELSNKTPDEEAMRFFELQKRRIRDLILEIESSAPLPPTRRSRQPAEPEARVSA